MGKSEVELAAKALSDLNTFAAVVTILEGGHLMYPGRSDVDQKIIRLCQREQQKLLKLYDKHTAAAQEKSDD